MVAFFLTHFWHFEFAPVGEPWYHGQVWGNVVAVLPMALLALGGLLYHHVVLRRLHAAHDRHLKLLVDLLDPATDGGLAIVVDRLDETTPRGLKAVIDELETLRAEVVHNGGRGHSQAEPEREPPQGG
jgi:hypothetical protein